MRKMHNDQCLELEQMFRVEFLMCLKLDQNFLEQKFFNSVFETKNLFLKCLMRWCMIRSRQSYTLMVRN